MAKKKSEVITEINSSTTKEQIETNSKEAETIPVETTSEFLLMQDTFQELEFKHGEMSYFYNQEASNNLKEIKTLKEKIEELKARSLEKTEIENLLEIHRGYRREFLEDLIKKNIDDDNNIICIAYKKVK